MRRWAIRLAVLGAGAAMSAASAPTLSAWVDTTATPSGTVSSLPDWVAPAVDRVVAQKTEGGMPGFIRGGGTYHVCAKIAPDSGNPPSLLRDVALGIGSLATAPVPAGLSVPATGSPCAATDNRDSGRLTAPSAAAGMTAGTKTFSITPRDNANNTRTVPGSFEVDNTVPTATTFTAANKPGGASGTPEAGDVITLTFSEPVDPHAIIPGWDGTGTQPINPYFVNDGNNGIDRLYFYRGTTLTPLTAGPIAGIALGEDDYVSTSLYFDASTIAVSGNSLVITLGGSTRNSSNALVNGVTTDTGTRAATWSTNAGLYDRAGNPVTVANVLQAVGVKF